MDPVQLNTLRHSASHMLAAAVKKIYPQAKLAIGPAIAEGFYYDFEFPEPISEKDLPLIEKTLKKLIEANPVFEKKAVSKAEARVLLADEPYKLELLEELADGEILFYTSGKFSDLCAGPHVHKALEIKAVKLLKIAGAYWRGSEKNKMLTRIYGTAYDSQEALDAFLLQRAEAEKRDHRKLGKELDLFSFDEAGPGFPFFHNNGMKIWNALIDYWREEHTLEGYEEVKTPIMLSRTLWETSGHWLNYRENMYTSKIDDQDFAIKPMNCPGGMLLYKAQMHSYRDLPLRMGEIGLVHRHEKSGVLSGLFRVRNFHQDDAHIYMRPDQIKAEILGVLRLVERMYKTFGLDFHLELSTKPEKYIGSDEAWALSEKALQEALDATGRQYKINPGDGAFYGPKIDIHIKDAIGRTWQCGTIQLDMNLPERFDLTYVGEDNQKHRPVMIHRVIYGSMERFLGILIEHYAGKFPVWLAPVQVKLLTIADKHIDFVKQMAKTLQTQGIRVAVDTRSEKIGYKIRQAQMEKVPYMAVFGDQEVEAGTLAIRTRDGQQLTFTVTDFAAQVVKEMKERV